MTYTSFHVVPTTPVLGAEIHGIDLTGPLNDRQSDELHGALMEYQVVFFRDQDLSFQNHKDLGRIFGELEVHPYAPSQATVCTHLFSPPPNTPLCVSSWF